LSRQRGKITRPDWHGSKRPESQFVTRNDRPGQDRPATSLCRTSAKAKRLCAPLDPRMKMSPSGPIWRNNER
jgi:hypothetical protein